MAILIGLCFVVCEKGRINYVFIFEFNPRNHLSISHYLWFVSILCCIFGIFVTFSLCGVLDLQVYLYIQPILLNVLLVGVFLLPAPILFVSARLWFLRVLLGMMTCLFVPVKFRDFFVADIMTSTAILFRYPVILYLIYDAERAGDCIMVLTRELPVNRLAVYMLLPCVPYVIRACQCARRWKDSQLQLFPHFLNFLKYFLSMGVLVGTFFYVCFPSRAMFALLLVISVGSTLFSLYWDYWMDWGIFHRIQSDHLREGPTSIWGRFNIWTFRKQRVFNDRNVYFVAILFNFISRFLWLIPTFLLTMKMTSSWILILAYWETVR